jgi:hypothetical protein
MDDQSRPRWCQRSAGGCAAPPAVLLTYQTAPTSGRLGAPGAIFQETFCRADLAAKVGAVYQAGGRVLAEEDLPPLSEPVRPEPIGLDAVDPGAGEG